MMAQAQGGDTSVLRGDSPARALAESLSTPKGTQ